MDMRYDRRYSFNDLEDYIEGTEKRSPWHRTEDRSGEEASILVR
jgi:hypothetical protein